MFLETFSNKFHQRHSGCFLLKYSLWCFYWPIRNCFINTNVWTSISCFRTTKTLATSPNEQVGNKVNVKPCIYAHIFTICLNEGLMTIWLAYQLVASRVTPALNIIIIYSGMMLQYRLGQPNDLNPQDQSISNDDEFRLKTDFFHVISVVMQCFIILKINLSSYLMIISLYNVNV